MKVTQLRTESHQEILKPNILYVDDEIINLKVFRSTFKRHYNIFTCESGTEALEILRKEDIQLIVTDQRMPNMNGTELLSKVVPNHPQILRMIMTGFSDLEVIIKAVNEYGIHQYITKPWDFEALKSVFDNLLLKPLHELNSKVSFENKQITKFAEGFVNKRNEEGFDLMSKYFSNSYLYNHSEHCKGEKNIFIHEFKKGDAIVAFIANSSVTGIRGSMLKSFVSDMAKDLLLSKGAFNPVTFFRDLCKATDSFLNDIEINEEVIELQMIYKFESKPSTWVLTNKTKVLCLRDNKYVELEVHSSKPDEKLTIYRIEKKLCDRFYLFAIDSDKEDLVAAGNLLEQKILDLNVDSKPELFRIELNSYLDHEISERKLDKLILLEVVL